MCPAYLVSYPYFSTSSGSGTRDQLSPSTDVHTTADPWPVYPWSLSPCCPTATRPGPPRVTLAIDCTAAAPKTASSEYELGFVSRRIVRLSLSRATRPGPSHTLMLELIWSPSLPSELARILARTRPERRANPASIPIEPRSAAVLKTVGCREVPPEFESQPRRSTMPNPAPGAGYRDFGDRQPAVAVQPLETA